MVQLAKIEKRFEMSPNRIYRYVTDMENYKNWFPGVIDIRAIDDLPVGTIGKRYVETIELPSGLSQLTIEVKEVIPNRKFLTEGDLPFLLPRMTIDFSDNDDADCLLSLTYESRSVDIAADRAVVDGLHSDLSKRGEAGLRKLEQILAS